MKLFFVFPNETVIAVFWLDPRGSAKIEGPFITFKPAHIYKDTPEPWSTTNVYSPHACIQHHQIILEIFLS